MSSKKVGKTKKEWIVMIYMAADNDLGDESVWALTEIASLNLSEKIGVAVLFDSGVREVPTQVFKFGFGNPKPNFPFAVNPPPINTFNPTDKEKNASDPDQLKKFLEEMMKHDANHYMLILSGHGSGAVGDFLKGGPKFKGMSIPSLSNALQEATKNSKKKKINVLGMDSCLMSMVEVCYQLPESVEFLVGSEGYDPTTGWPYKPILQRLSKAASSTPKQAAQIIVDEYVDYYTDFIIAGTSIDIAFCDLQASHKGKLASALKELAEELKQGLENQAIRDAIILAHWEAQAYKRETYTDLWDFCNLLQARFEEGEPITVWCEEIKEAINEMTHSSSRYYGPEFQHSHGLSIYFPWREFEEELNKYATLEFAKKDKTGWGSFLNTYLKVTRREKRGEIRNKQGQAQPIDIGTDEILFTPPLGTGGVFFQVHKAGNPPDKAGNPPDKAGNPPDKMGVFTRSASMKNPPDGFRVKKANRRKAVL